MSNLDTIINFTIFIINSLIFLMPFAVLINFYLYLNKKIKLLTLILIIPIYFASILPPILLDRSFYNIAFILFVTIWYFLLAICTNTMWLPNLKDDNKASILLTLFVFLSMISFILILTIFWLGILVTMANIIIFSFVCFVVTGKVWF